MRRSILESALYILAVGVCWGAVMAGVGFFANQVDRVFARRAVLRWLKIKR